MQTHETFIQHVARLAIDRLDDEQRAKLRPFKLTYGVGAPGVRGVTYFGVWSNGEPEPEEFVEIGAGCEHSLCQLAGTTIHEIGHVLAGHAAGHGPEWVAACRALGLRRVHAAGTHYQPANFAPDVRHAIAALDTPTDGRPVFTGHGSSPIDLAAMLAAFIGTRAPKTAPSPCRSVHGCKGGKSRGTGSGSRMIKIVCDADGCGYTVRTTRKWIDVGLPTCPCGSAMSAT